MWTGKNTYWLNDGYGHVIARDSTAVHRDRKLQPAGNYGGECLSVYYHRLLRDGWKLVDRVNTDKSSCRDIFEKDIGKRWKLRKISHAEVGAPIGKGCYWDEHELVGPAKDQNIRCPAWEWADLDGDRLVWATNGRLCAAAVNNDGIAQDVVLHDFSDMTFKAIEAPY